MRIGIHGRDFQQKSSRFIERVLTILGKYKSEVFVSAKFQKHFKSSRHFKLKVFDQGDSLKNLDFFLSLGGDGTLLESITYVGKHAIPVALGFSLPSAGKRQTRRSTTSLKATMPSMNEPCFVWFRIPSYSTERVLR